MDIKKTFSSKLKLSSLIALIIRASILLLFFAFSYSIIDDCLKLSFEKTEIVVDDAENEKTDSEEKVDELEKDKVVLHKNSFNLFDFCFFSKNHFPISSAPPLLTAQYAITTPPPES